MNHRFDDPEAWAKVFDDPERDAWQKPHEIVMAMQLAPAMTVADIGAGTGYFTVRLAKHVPQGTVIATDLEQSMMDYLAKRSKEAGLPNVQTRVTPADDPQLAANSLDRILVVDVWHHLGDRAAYAKKLGAALRPGGQIYIVDFKLDATKGPPKEHRLAPETIIGELKAAGLAASLAPVTLSEQYVVVGTR